jgi:hypothetical protein
MKKKPKKKLILTPAEKLEALAHNEWMRRYIEEPERFAHDIRVISEFQGDEADGYLPQYGVECVLYLKQLKAELRKSKKKVRKPAKRKA